MYITDILQRGRLLQEDAVNTMTRAFALVIVFICIVLALRLAQYSKNTLRMCQANTTSDDLSGLVIGPTLPQRIGQRSLHLGQSLGGFDRGLVYASTTVQSSSG